MKDKRTLQLLQRFRTTNEGFTLLEVLIAIFVGSIVLTILYASFFQVMKAKERVEEELELYHESRIVMSKITKDIVTAFERGGVNSDEGNQGFQYFLGSREGEFSTLIFTSLARTPTPDARESDQTEISYFVRPIQGTDLYALIRRDNPTMQGEVGATQYALSERVIGFTLSYLGDTGANLENQELTLEWDANNTLSLPEAVNVNLVMRGPRGNDLEFNSLVVIPVVDGS